MKINGIEHAGTELVVNNMILIVNRSMSIPIRNLVEHGGAPNHKM
jgi:hypothetical protein